jgi:hypothetical protein
MHSKSFTGSSAAWIVVSDDLEHRTNATYVAGFACGDCREH